MFDIESAYFLDPRYSSNSEFCPENVRHRGQAFKGGKTGKYLEGVIDLYDREGYRISDYNGHLLASLTLKSDLDSHNDQVTTEKVYLNPNPDGSYNISYLVKRTGTWSLSVTNEKFEHVAGSPFDVEITFGDVSPDKSVLTSVEQVGYLSNFKEFLLQSRDVFGNDAKEGGTNFSATCLGGGKMISLTDCNNGQYRILCFLDETSSFSKLKVTLFGKDVLNSPFDLTTFYKLPEKPQQDLDNYNDLFQSLEKCKLVFNKNLAVKDNFDSYKDALEKVQKETDASYNSSRLGVVHSLPAVFSIEEFSKEDQVEKRKQLVSDYKEFNEQLSQVQERLRNLQNFKKDLNEYLVEKTKASRQLYKEALEEYNKATGKVLRMTRETKRVQQLRKNVLAGDPEAYKKLEKESRLEECLRMLRESRKPAKVQEKPKKEEEKVEVHQEEMYGRFNQTVPDRPNTLAFWLVEGRFRPPKKADSK